MTAAKRQPRAPGLIQVPKELVGIARGEGVGASLGGSSGGPVHLTADVEVAEVTMITAGGSVVEPGAAIGSGSGAGPGPAPGAIAPQADLGLAQDFETVKEVGRGGMGIVYIARQRSLDRPVALKALLPHLAVPHIVERFAAEARIMGRLEHPNIPPIHSIGRDSQGRPVLAMKLVKGVGWDKLIAPRTEDEYQRALKYDLRDHLDILRRVSEAVGFAHSRGILHRDLKPANIMIGEFGEVLVMDWGIAFDLNRKPAVRAPSSPGTTQLVGTPAYLAPEMAAANDDRLGPWTDVYLLGGILFQLLTGTPPRLGLKLDEVLQAARTTPIERPEQRLPGHPISKPLAEIAMKALDFDAAARHATASEFAAAIEAYFRHEASLKVSDAALVQTERAEKAMADGSEPRAKVYGRLSSAVASFEQAKDMWDENESAEHGLVRSRMALAACAIEGGDLGIAEACLALLPPEGTGVSELRARFEEAQAARRRERFRRRLLLGTLAVAILAVLGAAALAVNYLLDVRRRDRASAIVGVLEGTEKNDTELALWDKAVKADPKWPQARYQLGIQYLDRADERDRDDPAAAREDRRRAVLELDRAIELKAGARAYFQRGYAKEILGDRDGALADHRAGSRLDPDDFFAMVSAASAALIEGRFDEAIAAASRAIAKRGDSDYPYWRRGRAYVSLGRWEEALEDFAKCVELWDSDSEYHGRLADAYFALGRKTEAAHSLLAARERDPRHQFVLDRLARAALRSGDVARASRFGEAAVAAAASISTQLYAGEAQIGRARARRAAGDLAGAIADLETSCQLSPNGVLALFELAETLVERSAPGDLAAALAALETAVQRAPQRADFRALAAELAGAAARDPAAGPVPPGVRRLADEAAASPPAPGDLLATAASAVERGAYGRGRRLALPLAAAVAPEAAAALPAPAAAGSPPGAAPAGLEPAIGYRALALLARAAIAGGDPKAAAAALDRAISPIAPHEVLAELHRTRALARLAAGDGAGAHDDAGRALALGDEHPVSLRVHARGALARGEDPRAFVEADLALRQDPLDVEALRLRAEARGRMGDAPGREEDSKLAAELSEPPVAGEK